MFLFNFKGNIEINAKRMGSCQMKNFWLRNKIRIRKIRMFRRLFKNNGMKDKSTLNKRKLKRRREKRSFKRMRKIRRRYLQKKTLNKWLRRQKIWGLNLKRRSSDFRKRGRIFRKSWQFIHSNKLTCKNNSRRLIIMLLFGLINWQRLKGCWLYRKKKRERMWRIS